MGWQDDTVIEAAPAQAGTLAAGAPAPWEQDEVVQPRHARTAASLLDSIRAGYQGSATGLVMRGRLPDVVLDPEHSRWYDRVLAAGSQMGSDALLMGAGGIAGGIAGTAAGAAV